MRAGSIQRLVLIFPGALGDLLLVLPTLRLLCRRHASSRTTLVVAEPQRALAELAGVADRVASLDDASAAWLFGGSTQPPWLADRPVVFSWMGRADATCRARLAAVAGAVRVLAVERGPGAAHAAVAYARAAGVRAGRRRLAAEARLATPDSPRARALAAPLARPVLVMHRGAGTHGKRWPAEGFEAVARAWRRSRGDVVELLGPAEADAEPLGGAVPARDWGLPDAAALLGLADAYVGNDSGVTHLAGAVGTRGVVLFGATDPARWRPLAPTLTVLRARAIEARGPRPPSPSPDRVLRALRRLESLTSSHPGSSVRA